MKSPVLLLPLVALLAKATAMPTLDYNNNRIVNGTATTIERIPFQVSILFLERHYCGASILDETTILTAAHCFHAYYDGYYTDLSPWTGRVGSSYWSEGGQVVQFASIVRHPDYNPPTFSNDIAILKTSTPITLGASVKAVTTAPATYELLGGEILQISGWGYLVHGGDVAEVLQKITLPALSRAHCEELFQSINPIQPHMFCVGDLDGLGDSCNGDSGGPVVDENDVQVGIVSWGLECARPGFTGVYTYIPYMAQWIKENRN